MEHLLELRRRLLYSVVFLLVGFLVAFVFAKPIFNFLAAPLAELLEAQYQNSENRPPPRMIFTALHEQFFTEIRVAFFTGFAVAFPFIASQLWIFIAPGLFRNEKRAFLPFLLLTPFLFLAGASFVYYVVLPAAWAFFAGFQQFGITGSLPIELEPKVNEYLNLVLKLVFAFGVCFELPILLALLVRVGLATTEGLRRSRRYMIVVAFVVAAVLTPPDPLSQLSLAVPIILLYELSIILIDIAERIRAKRQAKQDAAEDDDEEDEDEDDDYEDDEDDDVDVADDLPKAIANTTTQGASKGASGDLGDPPPHRRSADPDKGSDTDKDAGRDMDKGTPNPQQ